MALPNRALLEELMATAQYKEAIDLLLGAETDLEEVLRLKVVALSGRLKNLSDKELGGLLSVEDIELERNKISRGLLDLIAEIPENEAEAIQINQRNTKKRLVQAGTLALYFALVAGALYWLFQPQRQIQIAADLLVDRLSFRYQEGPATFARGVIQQCAWQNYKVLQLEAEQVLIDENLDQSWGQSFRPATPLQIYANPDISGLNLQFGPARLEHFLLQPDCFLTLSRPAEEPRLFRIAVQQEQEPSAEWTFSDSLLLTAEQITIKGLGEDLAYEYPMQIMAIPPRGLAREMQLTGFPGTTTIDLQFLDSLRIESKDLLIKDISFYQPIDNVAIPTIHKGTVRIAETNKSTWKELKIEEGEALDLVSTQALQLTHLKIEPQGISISLSGKVQSIETGKLHESHNPLRLEWLWQNKLLIVLVFCAGFLLFTWFFFTRIGRLFV